MFWLTRKISHKPNKLFWLSSNLTFSPTFMLCWWGTSIHSLLSPKCVHSVWCNYPGSSTAAGMWTLHATAGSNIQLHFLDFDTEATHDMVEVRDGAGPNSSLLGEDVIYTQSYYHFLLLLSENFIQLCFIFSYPHWKQWPRP